MLHSSASAPFFGWRVVGAAFVLAIFGWGIGFYGPPVYLHAVREARGWSVPLVSAAVTVHFLIGALVVANLPALYRRFGLPRITKAGAIILALGIIGWANALEPWQLFAATIFSGAGWVAMGGAAINAIIAPWFVAKRPKALSSAYNGASIGGVIFSPLWVAAIAVLGFPMAAMVIGLIMVLIVWVLVDMVFVHTPDSLGQLPDGAAPSGVAVVKIAATIPILSGPALWKSWQFRTLAAGMALGLFAQIGLIAHLFSLLVPALGEQIAGLALGLATASAIAGRTAFGWLMPADADRRLTACLSYAIQIIGSLTLLASGATDTGLILIGIILFGFGIGNATSLPPLIAQVEFAKADTPRVVALIVAIGQGTYAFAPVFFGVLREVPLMVPAIGLSASTMVFMVVGTVQMAAILCLIAGRKRIASV